MVASRGPLPKRSDQRIRRNKAGADGITRGEARPVTVPRAGNGWHPIAKRLFKSLGDSGQADFYQDSDWALAFSLCDDLSRYKHEEDRHLKMSKIADEWYSLTPEEREERGLGDRPPHVPKGGSAMKLVAIYAALDNLMVSEGARRRLRVELEAPAEEQVAAEVVVMDEYRQALGI